MSAENHGSSSSYKLFHSYTCKWVKRSGDFLPWWTYCHRWTVRCGIPGQITCSWELISSYQHFSNEHDASTSHVSPKALFTSPFRMLIGNGYRWTQPFCWGLSQQKRGWSKLHTLVISLPWMSWKTLEWPYGRTLGSCPVIIQSCQPSVYQATDLAAFSEDQKIHLCVQYLSCGTIWTTWQLFICQTNYTSVKLWRHGLLPCLSRVWLTRSQKSSIWPMYMMDAQLLLWWPFYKESFILISIT